MVGKLGWTVKLDLLYKKKDKCSQDKDCLDKCPNTFNPINFVNLGCIPNFSFLDYVEVGRKDGLRVGGGWVGGFMIIMPRCGSILQAGTCQILSLAENPRWSRVWQHSQSLWHGSMCSDEPRLDEEAHKVSKKEKLLWLLQNVPSTKRQV